MANFNIHSLSLRPVLVGCRLTFRVDVDSSDSRLPDLQTLGAMFSMVPTYPEDLRAGNMEQCCADLGAKSTLSQVAYQPLPIS